jgi:hypothetical protein
MRQGNFPSGRAERVGSYRTYAEAQAAVDRLADRGFAVDRLVIVASDLRFVEQVTGRATYGAAALEGATSGALMGAFIGFLLGLFQLVAPLTSSIVLALWGLVIGAIVGLSVRLVGHALRSGRRDFSSVGGLQAGRYDVVAEAEVADEARRLLARGEASRRVA